MIPNRMPTSDSNPNMGTAVSRLPGKIRTDLPTVISFYAGAPYYYEAAKQLRADCESLGLDHSIDEITVPPGFNWAQICRIKSNFYLAKLRELQRPILWIDVDSRLRTAPEFLSNAKFDFAAFLRGFSDLDPYRLVQFARTWYPGVIFINATENGYAFAETLAKAAESYVGEATDDFFLEEAWRRHRSDMLALPMPGRMIDADGSNPDGFVAFGNSGNVAEFKSKVDQHANDKLANLRMKVLTETAKDVTTPVFKKALLRRGWTRDVTDINLMLETAKTALKLEPALGLEILTRAAYLHPKKFESRLILTNYHLGRGDLKLARQWATEMAESDYEDWSNVARSRLADIELEERAAAAGLTKAQRLPMWWAKNPPPGNFGDILNPYLVEKLTGNVPTFVEQGKGLLAIGSIIKFAKKGTRVWGTGSSRRSDFVNPEARYHAVRGPLTYDIVRKSGGYADKVFGDGALLLPSLYDPVVPKKHKVGYIPHYVHQEEALETDAHVLDIRCAGYDEIESFIRQIKECETIVSTSLHGIIVANAYGIPARWAFFSDGDKKVHGDDMKFQDYFMSVGMPVQTALDLSETRVLDSGHAYRTMSKTVDLKINLEALKNAFPMDLIPQPK